MIVRNNLAEHLKNQKICDLMTANGINALKLKEYHTSKSFNAELTKLYMAILKNKYLFIKLISMPEMFPNVAVGKI
jgi:hypothetical protein